MTGRTPRTTHRPGHGATDPWAGSVVRGEVFLMGRGRRPS
jgi:hypothetical protein